MLRHIGRIKQLSSSRVVLRVLHQTVLLVRLVTENIPRVAGPDRIKAPDLGAGFWQIEAHLGFAQTPCCGS